MVKKLVHAALKELDTSVKFTTILSATLSSCVYLLVFMLVAKLLGLRWYYSLIPSTPIVVWLFYTRFKKANLYLVEHKLPDFRDQLTTAADNMYRSNKVIDSFHKDVVEKIRNIKNTYFIHFGKLTAKVVVVVVLSLSIIAITAFNLQIIDIEQTVTNIRNGNMFFTGKNSSLTGEEGNDNIYGDAAIAELGYEELDVQLTPLNTEIDIQNIEEAENREFRERRAAQEIIANNDGTYSDNVPKEYRQVVKTYFRGIAEDG